MKAAGVSTGRVGRLAANCWLVRLGLLVAGRGVAGRKTSGRSAVNDGGASAPGLGAAWAEERGGVPRTKASPWSNEPPGVSMGIARSLVARSLARLMAGLLRLGGSLWAVGLLASNASGRSTGRVGGGDSLDRGCGLRLKVVVEGCGEPGRYTSGWAVPGCNKSARSMGSGDLG